MTSCASESLLGRQLSSKLLLHKWTIHLAIATYPTAAMRNWRTTEQDKKGIMAASSGKKRRRQTEAAARTAACQTDTREVWAFLLINN